MLEFPKTFKVLTCVPVCKGNLPRIRVSSLMPEGHGKCARCGICATHVVKYTLEGDGHWQVYSNIFANTRMMTADHILPYSLGGCDARSNLQLMCITCNAIKGCCISYEEMQIVIQNRNKHIRPTFTPANMRHVLKMYPTLEGLYDLAGREDGPVEPFKKGSPCQKQNQPGRMKRIEIETGGLVNNKHPHHPMWGWVRIFERFPEMKTQVTFAY